MMRRVAAELSCALLSPRVDSRPDLTGEEQEGREGLAADLPGLWRASRRVGHHVQRLDLAPRSSRRTHATRRHGRRTCPSMAALAASPTRPAGEAEAAAAAAVAAAAATVAAAAATAAATAAAVAAATAVAVAVLWAAQLEVTAVVAAQALRLHVRSCQRLQLQHLQLQLLQLQRLQLQHLQRQRLQLQRLQRHLLPIRERFLIYPTWKQLGSRSFDGNLAPMQDHRGWEAWYLIRRSASAPEAQEPEWSARGAQIV